MSKKQTSPEVVKIEDYEDDRPDMYRVTMPDGKIYEVHADDEKSALAATEEAIETDRKAKEAIS